MSLCLRHPPTRWRLLTRADVTGSLAYAELNMTVATLMRPAGPRLRLFQTDESNIVPAHDFLIPLPKLDTKGVRVTVA